jgi:hypothetical protein
MVAADNVVYPGAPGYLEYVDGASYKTQMVEAKFEYDQKCEDIPSPNPQNVKFGYYLKWCGIPSPNPENDSRRMSNFTDDFFISPDLDGEGALKIRYRPRQQRFWAF